MTSQQFTALLLLGLKKNWKKILIAGLAGALLLGFYFAQKPTTYTANATLFPLNSTTERSTSSMLSALMGITDRSKSFSDDAVINIIELAESRAIREAVAQTRVQESGNKTIAELLLQEVNTNRGILERKTKTPKTERDLVNWAVRHLNNGLKASINKNNSFVLSYTGRSPELVRLVSYSFIEHISSFYIDLKREKARLDYDFATEKVDSLAAVLSQKDRQLVAVERRTMFTDPSRMEFKVPGENLLTEKQMIRNQYATAVSNQQDASYILQKATPVMKVLDKPEPPYKKGGGNAIIFAVIGFILAAFLAICWVISRLVVGYLRTEIRKLTATV